MCAAYQCHVACHRATMPYKRFGRDTGVSGMAANPQVRFVGKRYAAYWAVAYSRRADAF
jgi:hypothetical protein